MSLAGSVWIHFLVTAVNISALSLYLESSSHSTRCESLSGQLLLILGQYSREILYFVVCGVQLKVDEMSQ